MYQLFVDGLQVYSEENTSPASFKHVKVYCGNPWINPILGKIRDLQINPHEGKSKLVMSQLIFLILVSTKGGIKTCP